jgi:SAM-dependent methyltransferase
MFCGLVYIINHSKAKLGSPEYFDEHAKKRYFVEPHILDFAKFKQYKNKRVLEIGCGIGADGANYAQHGAEYTGIDISKQSIDLAEQRFECFDLAGEFKVMDAANTRAMKKLGLFDLVYSYGVIHHYPNTDNIIRNISAVLKPGADFRFMVYAKNSWKYAMIQAGLDQFEAQADCPYAEVYTPDSVKDMLGTDFDIVSITQTHCFMYNVPLYKQGQYELEPWFEAMPKAMRQAVKNNLGWHLLVHAKKN